MGKGFMLPSERRVTLREMHTARPEIVTSREAGGTS